MNYLKEFNIFDNIEDKANMPITIDELNIDDRVELIKMVEESDPIAPGTQGIIRSIHRAPLNVIEVYWYDSHRTLNLLFGVDIFKIINK